MRAKSVLVSSGSIVLLTALSSYGVPSWGHGSYGFADVLRLGRS